jgi:hypothetical protein
MIKEGHSRGRCECWHFFGLFRCRGWAFYNTIITFKGRDIKKITKCPRCLDLEHF